MVISIPKSGTHLIEKALLQFGFVKLLFLDTYLVRPPKDEESILLGIVSPKICAYREVRKHLSKIKTKGFALGHLPFSIESRDLLKELNFKTILILRDPRYVVVSQYHWVGHSRHPLNPHISKIKDPEGQLLACIKGWSIEETESNDYHVLSIAERINLILPWFRDPNCLVVRFEDLIGPQRIW